jgi:hypothetical protein
MVQSSEIAIAICSKNQYPSQQLLLQVVTLQQEQFAARTPTIGGFFPFLPFEIRILSAGFRHRSNTCWPWKFMSSCVFVFIVVLNEDYMYRCRM